MMALMDHVPVHETLGVFVGLSGYDWLSEGRTDALHAAMVSLAAGAIISVVRYQRRKRQGK